MAFEVLNAIKKRRSIRKFSDQPVEWDKIVNITEAGRFAPSAGNLQNWKFIVVTDKGKRKQLAEACMNQMWMASAPVIIAVVSKPEKTIHYYGDAGEKYTTQNAACAAMNMLLEAYEEGLGACWVSGFDEEIVAEILGIPSRARPEIMIPLGYADEEVPTPPREVLEGFVFMNKYNNRIKDMNLVMWDFSLMTEEFMKNFKDSIIFKTKKLKDKISQMTDEDENILNKDDLNELGETPPLYDEIHHKLKGIHKKIKDKLKK